MTMKNWIRAARVGTPCRFRRMVSRRKCPSDLGEENLHGAAVHINSEPNMAWKETMPTAVHQHRRQAEVRRQPFEHLYRTAGKGADRCGARTLISSDDTEYSTPMNSPETMITFTKARLPPASFTYTPRTPPPAARKIRAVMLENAG